MADAVTASLQLTQSLAANIEPAPQQTGSYTQTYPGRSGGSATVTANFAADGTGSETITYSNYAPGDGFTYNGSVTVAVLAPSTSSNPHSQYTLSGFQVVGGSPHVAFQLSGMIDRVDTIPPPGQVLTYEATSNLVFTDLTTDIQLQTKNFQIRTLAPTATGSMTASGEVFDSREGYVTVSADAPFNIDPTSEQIVSGGPLRLAGNASNLWIARATSSVIALSLDPTGQGSATQSVALDPNSGAESQLAAPASTAAQAAAGPSYQLVLGVAQTLEGRLSGYGTHKFVSLSWTLALAPAGSNAVLANASTPTPVLAPDVAGTYVVKLTCTDGSTTTHDAVVLTLPDPNAVPPPTPPTSFVAYLGPDVTLAVGGSVTPTAAFSSWPLAGPPSVSYIFVDPTGKATPAVTGAPSITPPTWTTTQTGVYESVLVLNDPTTGGSATQYFGVGVPLDFFRPAALRAPATASGPIAIADLNGDGHPDLVTSSVYAGVSQVVVYSSIGPGRFASPTMIAAGNGGDVAVGDFNGDGRPDIVTASSAVDLITQNPDQTWAAPVTLAPPTTGACALPGTAGSNIFAVGDFNGDGRMDFAVAAPCGGVYLYQQSATGALVATAIDTNQYYVSAIAAADVNGDGIADLIIAAAPTNDAAPGQVYVYLGGAAGLGPRMTYTVPNSIGTTTLALAVADYTGDGKADVVVGNREGFYVFAQTAGTLAAPVRLGSSDALYTELRLRDLNGDGCADLVASTAYGLSPTRVFYQQADGTVGASSVFPSPMPGPWYGFRFVDLDGDGLVDIVTPDVDVILGRQP
jgi:hypothetical protein